MKRNRFTLTKIIGAVLSCIGIILLTISIFILNDGKKQKNNEKEENNEVTYDSIKSHNINKKTKVSFPLYDNVTINNNSIGEFNVSYSNKEGLYINGRLYSNDSSLEENENKQYNDYKELLENQYKQVENKDIECIYLCKNYKVYNDDKSIFRDELRIYIETADNEVAELTYRLDNAVFPSEKINNIIKDIKISYDAKYTIGTIKDDNLILKLDLRNNKFISLKLDKNKFEEVENEYNSKSRVTLKDKTTSTNFTIVIHFKFSDRTLINEIDKLHFGNNSSGTKEELKIDNKTIYKYTIDDSVGYAYLIDGESALLVESNTSSINIEDIMKSIEE